jgi:protein phosphatase 1D
LDYIENQKGFWSDKDEDILGAIRRGFRQTHLAMWVESENLPKTVYELHMSGSTASLALISKGKIYIGHVGDSSIVLGYQDEGKIAWKVQPLTRDHKPESADEMAFLASGQQDICTPLGSSETSLEVLRCRLG